MTKGGYDKLLKKLQESNSENLRLQQEIVASKQTISELRENASVKTEKGPKESRPRLPKKISSLWNSHAGWGALSVLLGIVVEHISRILVFTGVGIALHIEFIRAGFFPSRLWKVIGNSVAGLALAAVLWGIWKYTPWPSQEISPLDAQLDAISKRFPWLVAGPKIDIPKIEIPKPSEHTHVFYVGVYAAFRSLNLPPLRIEAGASPIVPIAFMNIGDFPIESADDAVAFVPVNQEEVSSAFHNTRKTMKFLGSGGTLPAHTGAFTYHTVSGLKISEDMMKQFVAQKLRLCAFGAVKWKDSTGQYETDYGQCALQEGDGTVNWHSIPQNNAESKLK